MIAYPIKLVPDEDSFLAASRDFPELTTFGLNRAEALHHAAGALSEAIAARIAHKRDIPRPSAKRRGEHLVALPAQAAIKLLLHESMKSQGVRKAELARRIGVHKQEMDRIFSVKHSTSLQTLEKAFQALGKKLDISIVDAA